MIRTFKDMQDGVLVDARRADNPTVWRPYAMAFLNQAYFELAGRILTPSNVETWNFSTVVGQRTYPLPVDFNGLIGAQIQDKAGDTSFAARLREFSMQRFRDLWPSGVSQTNSQPQFVRVNKVDGVMVRNQGTDPIQAYSSSALDTTAVVSAVAYADSTRATIDHGSKALNGVTHVTLLKDDGSSMASYEVFAISKDYTKGVVTVIRNSTVPVVLGTISPWQKSPEFCVIEFHDTADAIYNIRIEYQKSPIAMVNDTDVPLGFPAQFTEAIEWGARWRMRDLGDDLTRTTAAKQNFDGWKAQLLAVHEKAEPEDLVMTWDEDIPWRNSTAPLI